MSVTPLVLLSELKAQLSQAGSSLSATADARIRTLIEEESDRLQKECHRRFDERIETRYFDFIHKRSGGPLFGLELELDDDLRSVSSISNGDGSAISTGDVILTPRNETVKTSLRLDRSKSVFWQIGANDPYGAIAVTGLWGWRGAWSLVDTLSDADFDASELSATVSNGALFEVGMTLKMDSEYLRVSAINSNTLTFATNEDGARNLNGSAAAAHDNGVNIYRWAAEPIVQNMVKRLVIWRLEQDKSPLFGQVVLGDVSFPVDVSSMPQDVQKAIIRADLVRYTVYSA